MISNKTAATLFLIVLNMKTVASTSPCGSQGPSTHGKSAPMKSRRRASKVNKSVPRLLDTDNTMNPVEVQGGNTGGKNDTLGPNPSDESTPPVKRRGPRSKPMEISLDGGGIANSIEILLAENRGLRLRTGRTFPMLSNMNSITMGDSAIREDWEKVHTSEPELSSQTSRPTFEIPIIQVECDKLFELDKEMESDELPKQPCPLAKILNQYQEHVDSPKSRGRMTYFYIYGEIEAVKEIAIAKSSVYKNCNYDLGGYLETALPLALEKDRHDRVIELLNVRKEISAEEDDQLKREGVWTSFELFVSDFLYYLAPWNDGMAFKRFLTFHGDELREKHPDILDTLCQELIKHLRIRLDIPEARKLLTDLNGQSSLLTPMSFTKGFLHMAFDKDLSNFIEYGWYEAIHEGLKRDYHWGGEELWRVMKRVRPSQFSGDYPDSADALDAVLAKFPTKQQKEEQWIRENVPGFLEKIERVFADIFPTVPIFTVIEYARPTWIDV